MKKIISILVIMSLILCLGACSNKEPEVVVEEEVKIVEPFDFGEYDYAFGIEIDGINVSMPATLGEYMEKGFVNDLGEFNEEENFQPGFKASTMLKTPNGATFVVNLSNPTDHNLSVKDVFVSGVVITFNDELEKTIGQTKIYPSFTDATQRYLFSGLSIEDSEIVLGSDARLIDFEKDYSASRYLCGSEDIPIEVNLEFISEEDGLKAISINYLNLM